MSHIVMLKLVCAYKASIAAFDQYRHVSHPQELLFHVAL